MACATAWLAALLERLAASQGPDRLINVSDESWKIVQHTGLGEWFQHNFKLARRYGVANVVALHKVSDLQAAGDHGSRASKIAEGLIAEASTRVIYQQDEGQIPVTRQLLGLTESEAEIVTQIGPGQALWQVGRRSFVVQHYRSRLEARMTATDEGMQATRTTPA
jgi:type IV secretory pathway VirB4 component